MNKSINEQCWSILLEPFFYSVGAEGLQVSYSHKLQAGPAAEQEIREVGKKSQEFRQKRKRHVCLYLSFRGFCIYIYIQCTSEETYIEIYKEIQYQFRLAEKRSQVKSLLKVNIIIMMPVALAMHPKLQPFQSNSSDSSFTDIVEILCQKNTKQSQPFFGKEKV